MPAKRVLISIDERILARIDDTARRHGMTRSGFLAQAAMAQMEGGRRAGDVDSTAVSRANDENAKGR